MIVDPLSADTESEVRGQVEEEGLGWGEDFQVLLIRLAQCIGPKRPYDGFFILVAIELLVFVVVRIID